MEINLVVKCSYCKSRISMDIDTSIDSEARAIKIMSKDNTILCRTCANNKNARIWLENYIFSDTK